MMNVAQRSTIALVWCLSVLVLLPGWIVAALLDDPDFQRTETKRVEWYRARNYTWPLQALIPDTLGLRKLTKQRFEQVANIPDLNARYEGYIQTRHGTTLVANFTEHFLVLHDAQTACGMICEKPYKLVFPQPWKKLGQTLFKDRRLRPMCTDQI
jgi:hypothetical protein